MWRDTASPAHIDSFCNLHKTRGDGTHVLGLIEGIRKFVGGGRQEANTAGVVAAVAVILADVIYGNPAKDRLETAEARIPVKTATHQALTAWAETHAAAAMAVRGRKTKPRR